jgi:hypothetical protein
VSWTVSCQTDLVAPPAEVFAYLADPSTAAVIDPAIISYEPDGGTMGLGVHNTMTLRVLGLRLRSVSETVAWEPPRRMAFRSITPRHPITVDATHQFADDADTGGTEYTWTITVAATNVLGRVAGPVAAWAFRRNARGQQRRLGHALGSSSGHPPDGSV